MDNNQTFDSDKDNVMVDKTGEITSQFDYAIALLNVLLSAKHQDQKLDDFIDLMASTFTTFDVLLFNQCTVDHLFLVRSTRTFTQNLTKQPFPLLSPDEISVLKDLKFSPSWCENYKPYVGPASAAVSIVVDVGERHYVLMLLTDDPLTINDDVIEKTKYCFDAVKIVLNYIVVAEREYKQAHTEQQTEKLAALGKLAAGVAHEINNPLGFVMSDFNTLSADIANVKQRFSQLNFSSEMIWRDEQIQIANLLEESADIIGESLAGLTRIKNIVASLNVYNHSPANHLGLVDLRDVVSAALSMIGGEVKHKASIEYRTPDSPFYVEGLAAKLQQVLIHLLLNALQSITHNEGKIAIQLLGEEGVLIPRRTNICLLITDNGKGIPKQDLLHIFDPFFTTKQVGNGAGLGLSVAKEIISEYHGTITIDSTVSIGTTVYIRLPLLMTIESTRASDQLK